MHMNDVNPPLSGREQTDESLRQERERADRALDEDLAAADGVADAVIFQARERADALLARSRASSDKASSSDASQALQVSRAVEDGILERERVTADTILRDERADHVAMLSHERNATDRDLSRERARSDHALSTRDEFMGIVSHDLLTMLHTMVFVSALIEKEARQENGVEHIVTHSRRLQRSGTRMRRLVGDLVDVASIEAGKLAVTCEVGDPAGVVTEAYDTFVSQAAETRISLVLEIVPPVAKVAFDAARILQVLCNLLTNALKFVAAEGTVVIRVESVNEDVLFSVSDTGDAIPDDKLEAVFDRFVQLTKNDHRGVGLGLYISKSIVHGHGGRIWAENRPGQGSTFCFTLPAYAGTAGEAALA
jgi:signal transduction histidine kinase